MTMLAWERDDEGAGHSVARWERTPGGWLLHGNEVLVGEEVMGCWFRVGLDEGWATREVEVRSVTVAGERVLRLAADDERRWIVDGESRPDLDGCVDVDVAATPLTNTFPVRRLAGLAVGESATSPVAWIAVPALQVTRVDQTYERLPDVDGVAAWRYSDPDHGAFVITVDADGLVIDYEGFARRVTSTSESRLTSTALEPGP